MLLDDDDECNLGTVVSITTFVICK